MKKIIILGSTGSIGTQVLDVVRAFPQELKVIGLSAHGNTELFKKQIEEFQPKYALQTSTVNDPVTELEKLAQTEEADLIVNSVCGSIGMWPTLAALEKGKNVALANKESMVMAGELVSKLQKEKGGRIVPIDSEPWALWTLLEGKTEHRQAIEKVIITASGGPFWKWEREQLEKVTREQARSHPNWKMGEKISIDCATLMNKAFEIIETRWMFDIDPERIDVTVHRQSIVHGFVQWNDGSLQATLSHPDMRIPIQCALFFPRAIKNSLPRVNLDSLQLTFERPDYSVFKGPLLAYESLKQGGIMPAALCLLNEVAVGKFIRGDIGFLEIYPFIEEGLSRVKNEPVNIISLKKIITTISK